MAARTWIERQGELAVALKTGQLAPLAWMAEVERLAAEVDPAELMAEINRAKITLGALLPTNDPRKRSIRFVDQHGAPRKMGFAAALFDFSPSNVITPHGHRNMVSSHLVVEGAFRVRNYDRIKDLAGAMVVRPTRDYLASTGMLSAMSGDRDNIHWFVPQGGPARTFDVIISGIDPAQPDYEIAAIDPVGGEVLTDGTIRAPIMEFEDASKKYVATL
ncbi:MAG: hypothetical protein ABL914_07565 [Novosphingobium sp.]|uniref:hypothetical protein n=1 Tax=Novosphingobium sp. TaxID=1874826 RepID=UPI0032B91BBB